LPTKSVLEHSLSENNDKINKTIVGNKVETSSRENKIIHYKSKNLDQDYNGQKRSSITLFVDDIEINNSKFQNDS